MKHWLPLALILMGVASPIFSADVRGQIEAGRTKFQGDKKQIITEVMNLDADSSKVFWPLYNDYQNDVRKVNDERVDLYIKYAQGYQTMNDEQAMDLLREAFSLEADRAKIRSQYMKKFEKALPGRVVARFFQADNKIDAIINASLAEDVPLVSTQAAQKLAAEQTGHQ